jgi:hypothetical protein
VPVYVALLPPSVVARSKPPNKSLAIIIVLGWVIHYLKLPEGASLFRPTQFKVHP